MAKLTKEQVKKRTAALRHTLKQTGLADEQSLREAADLEAALHKHAEEEAEVAAILDQAKSLMLVPKRSFWQRFWDTFK